MIHASCSFCNKPCKDKINILTITPISENPEDGSKETPEHLHICDQCLQTLILDQKYQRPEADSTVNLEDPEPGKAFVGMELHTFLCTQMYLSTQNIIFKQLDGTIIRDFGPWIRRKVAFVSQPDPKTNEIYVTLH